MKLKKKLYRYVYTHLYSYMYTHLRSLIWDTNTLASFGSPNTQKLLDNLDTLRSGTIAAVGRHWFHPYSNYTNHTRSSVSIPFYVKCQWSFINYSKQNIRHNVYQRLYYLCSVHKPIISYHLYEVFNKTRSVVLNLDTF